MTRVAADTEPAAVADAAATLRRGRPVVIPTDTVYGLAALPDDHAAMREVFALKRRPHTQTVAVLVSSTAQARELAAAADERFERLAARFWPGPLTVVLPRRAGLAFTLGAHEATIGLRCPDHAFVRALAAEVGPLATTSANVHGQPTPSTVEAVVAELGPVELAIDGGHLAGAPSTVVELTGDAVTVLRAGALDPSAVVDTARQ